MVCSVKRILVKRSLRYGSTGAGLQKEEDATFNMVRMSQRSYYVETRNTPEKYKEDLDVRPQRS